MLLLKYNVARSLSGTDTIVFVFLKNSHNPLGDDRLALGVMLAIAENTLFSV